MHIRSGLISRLLKASIFIGATVAVASIAVRNLILPDADLAASFANVTASFSDKFGFDIASINRRPPVSPLTTSSETLALAKRPERPNTAAVSVSSDQNASNVEPGPDVLLSQFKKWAAAQPNAAPPLPVQPSPSPQSAPLQPERSPPVPAVPKRRQVHPVVVRSQRPEPPMQSVRKLVRPMQNARAQVVPDQTAPAQK